MFRSASRLFAVVVWAIVCSMPANAGLQDEMNGMFDNLTNVTPGRAYNTGRRGVVTGGSLYARAPIMNPNLVSFRPPSFKGGCGGIDMFGGSFSFINGEQIQLLLRRIAQNAVGYAFDLAIKAMCPTCADAMHYLQEKVQSLNGMLSNSCKMSKAIVDTGIDAGKAFMSKLNAEAERDAANDGNSTDEATSTGTVASSETPYAALPLEKRQELWSNVVWEALDSSEVDSWFSAGDTGAKMSHILLSMIGSVIVKEDAAIGDDAEPVMQAHSLPRTFDDVDILVHGGAAKIYQSCTSGDKCLDPSPPIDLTLDGGFKQLVLNLLLGDGTTANLGIIKKMRTLNTALAFTTQEEKFLQMTGSLGLLKQFKNLATAEIVAVQMADVLASDMAIQLLFTGQKAVRFSVLALERRKPAAPTGEAHALLDKTAIYISQLTELRAGYARSLREAFTLAESINSLSARSGSSNMTDAFTTAVNKYRVN